MIRVKGTSSHLENEWGGEGGGVNILMSTEIMVDTFTIARYINRLISYKKGIKDEN